jgi:hypothetical protein
MTDVEFKNPLREESAPVQNELIIQQTQTADGHFCTFTSSP